MLDFNHDLPRVSMVAERHPFLVSRCRGKKVLHLGCVDSGLLRERFERKDLLHQKLCQVAEDLWGIDIDEAGIRFLRSKGFRNLFAFDVGSSPIPRSLANERFDVILASEIIEHVPSPGSFLERVRDLMTPGHTELIVTVPNAFNIATLAALMVGKERVHPDHCFWFSRTTAMTLLRKAGFGVREEYAYSFEAPLVFREKYFLQDPKSKVGVRRRPSVFRRIHGLLHQWPRRALVSALYARSPFWGDGIVLVATVSNANS